jgi:tetratricopeptide (TPR) repeat protein
MYNLAVDYRLAEKPDRAIPLLEESYRLRKQVLGPDDPATIQILNGLGLAYQEAKKPDRAIPLLQEALRRARARLGPGHYGTVAPLNNLALAYQAAGKLDLALPRLEEALRLVIAKLGPDHPDALTTMHNLAFAYRTVGKLDLALPLARQAAAGVEKRKFEHVYAGKIMKTVVACHEQLKQDDQADAWRRKWIRVVREKAGPQSLPYAGELWQLGVSLLRQKFWAEAETALRECLAILQRHRADAWTTFNTQSLLGGALLGQEKHAEAEPLLVQGYAGLKARAAKIPADRRTCLAQALERLVYLYDAWGRPDQAASWRKELEAERARQKK